MTKEYIIYCDESEDDGNLFSNFFGGALVRSDHIDHVRNSIAQKKNDLNFNGEIKWNKITENYESKYKEILDLFFDFVAQDIIKIRIMFTQNIHVAQNLTADHYDLKYFLLYYQFLKHAFGLSYSPPVSPRLRLYLDKIPDNEEKIEQFKSFILSLERYPPFRKAGITIQKDDITEVVSHEHDVLQCLDIVLGSIQFRLNNKHQIKPDGAAQRGKRTRAKERVYQHISQKIRNIYPNFNIGITTGTQGEKRNRWDHPYRHWRFIPTDMKIDRDRGKR
ncbi:MAG: DUF3800 domain-containing protein [Alphaproteobacteria bacterium]